MRPLNIIKSSIPVKGIIKPSASATEIIKPSTTPSEIIKPLTNINGIIKPEKIFRVDPDQQTADLPAELLGAGIVMDHDFSLVPQDDFIL